MIQLRTILKPADNTGAKRLRVIHVQGGSKRRFGRIGDIATAVVDQADPQGVVKDSEIVKALIVRTKKEFRRPDGSYVRFDDNAAVIIDSVMRRQACVAFLVNAPRVEQVKSVAKQNLLMPPKSTYFYPKIPSGVVARDISRH